MEALSRDFIIALPWELLCADGLVVMAGSGGGLVEGLGDWRITCRVEAREWM